MKDYQKILLRKAVPGDESQVKAIVFKALQEFNLQVDPEGIDADLNDLQANYSAKGHSFYILEDGGKIVGCGGLVNLGGGRMEIRKMYLLNSHRRMGLGKKLLETMVQEALSLQCREIVLDTASVLQQAIKLYRSFGFEEYKPDHLPERCDLAMRLILKT